jgi:hypothetical protein
MNPPEVTKSHGAFTMCAWAFWGMVTPAASAATENAMLDASLKFMGCPLFALPR